MRGGVNCTREVFAHTGHANIIRRFSRAVYMRCPLFKEWKGIPLYAPFVCLSACTAGTASSSELPPTIHPLSTSAMESMVISALIAVLALGSTTGATTYAANLLDGVVEVSELVPQPDPSLSNGVAVLDAVKDLPDIATLLEILADNATVATLLSPSNKALADLLDDLGMTSANELVAPTLYANRFPGPSNKLLLADCLRLHVIEGVATPENVTAESTFSTLFGWVALRCVRAPVWGGGSVWGAGVWEGAAQAG